VKRVGVLISGRGSNLQALIDAQCEGSLGGELSLVVSNVETARGLARARAAGIPTLFCDHSGRTRDQHDADLIGRLQAARVDLVCLAGYMRLLSPSFIQAFSTRILNVHPSLLPAFPGLEAQRQAWEHGAKVSGATVHLVDEGLDSGPIVLQESVPVLDSDTPDLLSARILVAEHRIYPRAVALILSGQYRIEGRRVLSAAEDE
jgi:phosphoribosylglycinamide formyltransferase-1